MRELIINKNDSGQRVDKFISKALPSLPKSLMYKYIRNKKIKVNKHRCSQSQILQENDCLQCYIAEEFFMDDKSKSFLQAQDTLDIVYEDENIMIMNKEIGLLCHSDRTEEVDTLVNRMKKYLYKKKEYDDEHEQSFTPALAHRLDRNTQGLVLGAKNAQSLRILNELIKERHIQKYYLAIVEGTVSKQKTMVHYHQKRDEKIWISDKPKEGYKEVKLSYQEKDIKQGYSLVEVELFSGKAHQIRAQFAHEGHPLLGDIKYKAKKSAFQYQALCAYKLVFHTRETSLLSYLNNKEFVLEHTKVGSYFKQL